MQRFVVLFFVCRSILLARSSFSERGLGTHGLMKKLIGILFRELIAASFS